jgi:hypothetical protein
MNRLAHNNTAKKSRDRAPVQGINAVTEDGVQAAQNDEVTTA